MYLSKEQKQKAIEIALRGESPLKYIESCGVSNPSCSWWNIRKYLQKNDPETYAKLPVKTKSDRQPDPSPTVKLTGPIRIETPEAEKVQVVETPEKTKPSFSPLPVCAVRSRVRPDCRYTIHGDSGEMYLSNGVMTLQFNMAEWKIFSREILTALDQLGVDK